MVKLQSTPPEGHNLGDTILGDISLIIFAVGLIANTVLLLYFVSNRAWRRLSDTLYLLTCVVDIVIIVFHLPVSLALTAGREAGVLFGSAAGCGVWGIVWNTAMRLSVFVIMVLTVSRMLILVYPFRRIPRGSILGAVWVYCLAQVCQATLPYWFGLQYFYFDAIASCMWSDYSLFDYPSASFLAYYFYRAIFEFATPYLVILICCVISIISLYRASRSQKRTQQDRVNYNVVRKNSATITIMLLACAYIVCNTPLVIISLLNFIDVVCVDAEFNFFAWDHEDNYCFIIFCVVSVLLNAAVNPVLFCSRVRAVKVWIRRCFRKNKGARGNRLDSKVTAPFYGNSPSFVDPSLVIMSYGTSRAEQSHVLQAAALRRATKISTC